MLSWLSKQPLWFKLQLVATLLLILPIWSFQYLPLNDWPNHLASMHLLTEYDAGIATYIQPNHTLLLPNATVFYFMRYLGPDVGVETAGRLLLTLYLILMPWALTYLLRQFHPSLQPLGMVGAALSYNWFFSMGFLDFVLALPLFLLTAAYWMENRHRLWPKPSTQNKKNSRTRLPIISVEALRPFAPLLILTFLVTLTFLTHLVAGACLSAFFFFMRLRDQWPAFAKKQTRSAIVPSLGSSITSTLRALGPDILSFLPSLAVGLLSLPAILSSDSISGIFWGTLSEKLQYFLIFPPAPAYTAIGVAFAFLILAISLGRSMLRLRPEPFLLLFALVLLIGTFLLPINTTSWQFAAPRLIPFFIFALFLSFAFSLRAITPASLLSFELPLLLFLLVFAQVFWLASTWAALQPSIGQMAHLCDQMPAHSRVLPLGSGLAVPNGELGNFPYFHAWGYWVVNKDIFSPYLFSAAYTPIVYDSSTSLARNQVMVWLTQLVSKEFSNPSSSCSAWQTYYHQINWSLVSQQYDYVALREGTCDNATYMPASFRLVYSDSPLYLYKTN